MRVTPIPDDELFADHVRRVIAPPPDHPIDGPIRPVEAQVIIQDGMPLFRFRIECDPGDAERLAAGEPLWLSMWGHVVPWDVDLTEIV